MMPYPNHHWPSQPRGLSSRNDYPANDDDDAYYSPSYSRPPLQQPGPPPRRRANPPPLQDPNHTYYPRHRDDRDGWATWGPGIGPDIAGPYLPRRQSSTTTNGTSDYAVPRARSRHRARSSSATRAARSKSSSPRRHASSTTLPTAPPPPMIIQLSLTEREAIARQRLRSTFETHVFNTLPTYLLRISDMTLVTRNEILETFTPRIDSPSDSNLAKLLLEQDECARKLGVPVTDPEVLAPFTDYVRSMIAFAIFSHRWGNSEPLFHELPSKRLQVSRRSAPTGQGYQKLLKLCEKARTDYGCEYVWMDTCCINKDSSTELEEAILSMGLWYSEASVCIAHLANSSTLEDLTSEPWFTRGWTLQELLLSRKIRFYGKDWSPICPVPTIEGRREERGTIGKEKRDDRVNDKDNDLVIAAITKATGIPDADLRSFTPSCTRVSEKMRWASQRTTSRVEDMAYSLLALFDVTVPIAYGEGARAFHKLMGAITEHCTDPDFFAWTGTPSRWSLALPSSAQCYAPQPSSQGELVVTQPAAMLGDPSYERTKLGIRMRLVFVPVYCEPLEPLDALTARYMLTPALATVVQEPIQMFVALAGTALPGVGGSGTTTAGYQQGYGGPATAAAAGSPRSTYDRDHECEPPPRGDRYGGDPMPPGRSGREREPRERERERERVPEREYALGVVDYDGRAGPPGYAALHAGRAHLCLVLEREPRRGRPGWVRMARPGAVSVRFRESELLPVESACLLHSAA